VEEGEAMRIAIILLSALLISSCLFGCAAQEKKDDVDGWITEEQNRSNQGRIYPVEEMQEGYVYSVDIQPLDVEYLIDPFDPSRYSIWRLHYYGNIGDPPREVSFIVQRSVMSVNMIGSGFYYDTLEEEYLCTFESAQELEDLILYVAQYPDVFFDHSLFDPVEGVYNLPEGCTEWFKLSYSDGAVGNENTRYEIVKGFVPDDPVPEIQYVLETFKNEFIPEILRNPM
jgi:hypothetical protein